MKQKFSQVHAHLIARARSVAIVAHKNPDADTLGAAVAFYGHVKHLGLDAILWCKTPANKGLGFLPHFGELRSDPELWSKKQFDTVCVFDAGDIEYAGLKDALRLLNKKPIIINFDHHATNTKFGDYNLLDIAAASTTEILFKFFQTLNIAIDARAATALLAGLMTDTGNFINPATTDTALSTGAALVRMGGNYHAILSHTYRNKSIAALKLWGVALSRLKKNQELDIAYTAITESDLEATGALESETEGISNFLNALGETKISLVLKETRDGCVKGSLRTTRDDVDVSRLAKVFGGGGHKKAAGFAVRGRLCEQNGEWIILMS